MPTNQEPESFGARKITPVCEVREEKGIHPAKGAIQQSSQIFFFSKRSCKSGFVCMNFEMLPKILKKCKLIGHARHIYKPCETGVGYFSTSAIDDHLGSYFLNEKVEAHS